MVSVDDLIKRARASLLHIECFYEAKDSARRIQDMIAVIEALTTLQSRVIELEEALAKVKRFALAEQGYGMDLVLATADQALSNTANSGGIAK